MKLTSTIASLMLSLLVLPCMAQDAATETKTEKKKEVKNVDPTGTWRWSSENNGDTSDHELKISTNEKKELVAVYSGLVDELKSKKGEVKGDTVTFDFAGDWEGADFAVKFVGKIKDDAVTGNITIGSDQGSQDHEWNAKRSVELSDVVGAWQLKISSPEGNSDDPTFVVKGSGDDDYAATYTSEKHGEFKVADLKAKKDKLTFTVTGTIQDEAFVAKCVTLPRADKLKGEILLEIQGAEMTLDVTGERKKKKE